MRREHIKDGWWERPGEPIADIWPGTKNAQSHRIWLAKPVQELIDKLGDAACGFVFAGARGRPVSDMDGVMRTICKKLNVERAPPHDLRRTFSSKVTGLGFGRDPMNRVTNHKEGGISSVYDRYSYSSENRHIMESVAAHILALAEGKPASNVVQIQR
jgi:integrase